MNTNQDEPKEKKKQSKKDEYRKGLPMLIPQRENPLKAKPSRTSHINSIERPVVFGEDIPSEFSYFSNKHQQSSVKHGDRPSLFFDLNKSQVHTLNFKDNSFGSINHFTSLGMNQPENKNIFEGSRANLDFEAQMNEPGFDKQPSIHRLMNTYSPNFVGKKTDFHDKKFDSHFSPFGDKIFFNTNDKKKHAFEDPKFILDSQNNLKDKKLYSFDPIANDNTNKFFEHSLGMANPVKSPGMPWTRGLFSSKVQVNNIVNHINYPIESLSKPPEHPSLGSRIELDPLFNKEPPFDKGTAVFTSNKPKGNLSAYNDNRANAESFGASSNGLFLKHMKQFESKDAEQPGNMSELSISCKPLLAKESPLALRKRDHSVFQSNLDPQRGFETGSDISLSKFINLEKKPGAEKSQSQIVIPPLKKADYQSHNIKQPQSHAFLTKKGGLRKGFQSHQKEDRAGRKNLMKFEFGLYFEPSEDRQNYIVKRIKDLKLDFLKMGIRMDKVNLWHKNKKYIMFDESLGNRFRSFNRSNYTKSMSVLDESKSFISVKIFDETFYNKFLLKDDSFNNILHNTFLLKLKKEDTFDLFKNYLEIMDEMKTWMFQEFEEGKGYSNAEQFIKYFNLQVPINQQYFSGLSVRDKIKLICFFFCKFFNRNIIMTLFGDVWPQIKIHHNYKTHSKMYVPTNPQQQAHQAHPDASGLHDGQPLPQGRLAELPHGEARPQEDLQNPQPNLQLGHGHAAGQEAAGVLPARDAPLSTVPQNQDGE